MLTERDLVALTAYRKRLFDGIRAALAEDSHCKSYEGEIAVSFPTYFEDESDRRLIALTLNCYVLGPSRRYQWTGPTLADAVAHADADLTVWLIEKQAERDGTV